MPMKIELDHVYETRNGGEAWIAGHVPLHPGWVWSTQGNWYEESTGKLVRYGVSWSETEQKHVGKYFVNKHESGLDLTARTDKSWRT